MITVLPIKTEFLFTDNGAVRYCVCWSVCLVRSGHVNPANTAGTFRNAGQNGNWWSSRGADNIWGSAGLGGYNLNFNATGVNPSNGPTERYVGFPLRCLDCAAAGADL